MDQDVPDEDEIRKLLAPQSHKGEGYSWELCALQGADHEVLPEVAKLLAERIVAYLCPEHVADLWLQSRSGQRSLTPQERELLIVFLEPQLGHPEATRQEHDERAQGAISEFLWYELVRHRSERGRKIAKIEGPGFAVTDPGGDGLVVYESESGFLAFRLWEIKKHIGRSNVSETVGNAQRQLNTRALSYLARYTSVSQQLTDRPDLQQFYATLVDKWQEMDDAAGAGVAVATSCFGAQDDCFTGLPNRFPHLKNGDRLEGLLSALGEFAQFVDMVKDEIWRGL